MKMGARDKPRSCELCGSPFLAETYEIRRGRARFCSISCASKAKTTNTRQRRAESVLPTVLVELKSIPVPHCGCWIWMGSPNNTGYGMVRYLGTRMQAHRFSWAAFNGRQIPDGMVIMHMCDTPLCVNPNHLHLGTQSENMADAARKGRMGRKKTKRGFLK